MEILVRKATLGGETSITEVHVAAWQAICAGMSISMFSLAMLGIIEFVRGFVGIGIFFAITTEIILGVSYFRIWASNKNA